MNPDEIVIGSNIVVSDPVNTNATVQQPKPTKRARMKRADEGDEGDAGSAASKVTLADLKARCRELKLPVSGKKDVVQRRIVEHLERSRAAVAIQARWRGAAMRSYVAAQGEHVFGNFATICTNKTDFNTLDDLNEVAVERRFLYKDAHGFYSGFDIESFEELLRRSNIIREPTAASASSSSSVSASVSAGASSGSETCAMWRVIRRFIPPQCLNLQALREAEVRNPFDRQIIETPHVVRALYVIAIRRKRAERQCASFGKRPANTVSGTYGGYGGGGGALDAARSKRSRAAMLNMDFERQIKQFAIETFQKMDELGNYTDHEWLWTLSPKRLVHFKSELFEIWNYRAGLSNEAKRDILPPDGCIKQHVHAINKQYQGYVCQNKAYFEQIDGYASVYNATILCDAAATATNGDAAATMSEGTPPPPPTPPAIAVVKVCIHFAQPLHNIQSLEGLHEMIFQNEEFAQIQSPKHRSTVLSHIEITWRRLRWHRSNTNAALNQIRLSIVHLIDRFVSAGINHDSRVLGTYYVLGALTLVSEDAATAIPWLYQSFVFG